MKKLILAACAVICAASVFAQGTVVFNNRVAGTLITHVYAPLASNPTLVQVGNGTADVTAGTTDWSAWTPLSGSGFSAQIWAALGAGQPEASLQAASPITSFRTGLGAGFFAAATATLAGVPGDSTVATLTVRVWDNQGGTITSWQQATTTIGVATGEAPLFNVNNIGGTLNTPPNLVGLQSFNISQVPEPSTFALAGLGAAALLIFRRRK